jgi:superfamily I DNA/RNA helicase
MDIIHNPTAQQQSFLTALTATTSNLALVARAGCGKTSTILLGVDAYRVSHPNAEIVVCAYNKAIADEVKVKLIAAGHADWRKVSATTIHSLGFGLIKFVFKSAINENKVYDLVQAKEQINTMERDTYLQYGAQIATLVRYAKQAGVGFFNDVPIGDVTTWHELADHFDVNGLEETDQMDAIVECAQVIYRESLALTSVIDFDDMILFPLIKNLRVKFGKDLIFLDEAQDLSRARQALAKKFVKPGGRMVIVGDDRQAIYGFSGADAAALDNLTSSLGAIRMPLSITWRCPKAVVRLAQRYVPDIEAAETAPEGEVAYLTELPEDLKPGDAILCRNTAPLIKIAYSLIRKSKPCKVEGRAIGDGLLKLVGRWKINTIAALIKRIEDYKEREVQKAIAKGSEAKAEEVTDRCDTILEICHACIAKDKTAISDVKEFIANLFADGAEHVIVLATYHRSKGREWKRVLLWEHATRCPSKAAKQPWQRVQEDNLAYVAITRSQHALAFVN